MPSHYKMPPKVRADREAIRNLAEPVQIDDESNADYNERKRNYKYDRKTTPRIAPSGDRPATAKVGDAPKTSFAKNLGKSSTPRQRAIRKAVDDVVKSKKLSTGGRSNQDADTVNPNLSPSAFHEELLRKNRRATGFAEGGKR